MAISRTVGARIKGIASAVPERTLTVSDDAAAFGSEDAQKISESTGVRTRHVVSGNMCTSDLCFAAADRLIEDLNWERNSIDALIFVSQTPDYIVPATSCTLHGRLGLSKQCAAFDINLGCSGYVYGLSVISQMVASGGYQRALLLVGDTASRIVSPLDRSAAPLFGDAGTATAIEHDANAEPIVFNLGTDGGGSEHLVVPAGLFRQPHTAETAERTEREDGNIRSDEDLRMNGAEVFMFTLCEVPALVKNTLKAAEWDLASVDGVVMHQANQFMLRHIAKRLKLSDEQLVLALEDYGNTSSASIPLAITHTWAKQPPSEPLRLLLAGFGVGWSWGGAAVVCESLTLPELIVVPDAATECEQATEGERRSAA